MCFNACCILFERWKEIVVPQIRYESKPHVTYTYMVSYEPHGKKVSHPTVVLQDASAELPKHKLPSNIGLKSCYLSFGAHFNFGAQGQSMACSYRLYAAVGWEMVCSFHLPRILTERRASEGPSEKELNAFVQEHNLSSVLSRSGPASSQVPYQFSGCRVMGCCVLHCFSLFCHV